MHSTVDGTQDVPQDVTQGDTQGMYLIYGLLWMYSIIIVRLSSAYRPFLSSALSLSSITALSSAFIVRSVCAILQVFIVNAILRADGLSGKGR